MDVAELRDTVKLMLNFNSTGTDQAYTNAQYLKAINFAEVEETNILRNEGLKDWMKGAQSFTWAASTPTIQLPTGIKQHNLISFRDITNNDIGTRLAVGSMNNETGLFWADNQTLQWGLEGPSSDRTIRVVYYKEPGGLVADSDTPSVIPPRHHELLALSATIWLRMFSFEKIPAAWLERRSALRMQLNLDCSKPRTREDVNNVEEPSDYSEDVLYY